MEVAIGLFAFVSMAVWFYSIEHSASIWKLLKLEGIFLFPASIAIILMLSGTDTFHSALTLTIASSGGTYVSLAFAIIRLFKKQVSPEGGIRPLLTRKTLENVLDAIIWGTCFWGIFFAINFYKSYQVFHHPPQWKLVLTSEDGIELAPGTTFPEEMGNRRQYVIEITRTDTTEVASNGYLEIRFPFVVEQPRITYTDTEQATFSPLAPPLPVIVRGNAQSLGEPEYRDWEISVINITHKGKVRFTFLLNPDYRPRIIRITFGKKPKVSPPPLPAAQFSSPYKWKGPKYHYVLMNASFSYGGRQESGWGYAPLIMDLSSNRLTGIGEIRNPPQVI
jgi:hypothetical protein